jgi:hypothetical protein
MVLYGRGGYGPEHRQNVELEKRNRVPTISNWKFSHGHQNGRYWPTFENDQKSGGYLLFPYRFGTFWPNWPKSGKRVLFCVTTKLNLEIEKRKRCPRSWLVNRGSLVSVSAPGSDFCKKSGESRAKVG